MGILNFLFGKGPGIFNNKGRIQHDLKNNVWESWDDRYQNGPEYNWKNHSGMKAGAKTNKESKNKN